MFRSRLLGTGWYFSQKFVTVQERYGASFAVQVQIWFSITRVSVQKFNALQWRGPGLSPVTKLS